MDRSPSKVLLLSGNDRLRERVRARLEEDGAYELLACADGGEGLRLVEAGGVELVLYDAELALDEGVAAASRIRTRHPFLPMIPVTSILREAAGSEGPYAPPDRTTSGGASADEPL